MCDKTNMNSILRTSGATLTSGKLLTITGISSDQFGIPVELFDCVLVISFIM